MLVHLSLSLTYRGPDRDALKAGCGQAVQFPGLFYGIFSSVTEREEEAGPSHGSSSVLACPLDSVGEVGDRKVLAKLASILDNPSPTCCALHWRAASVTDFAIFHV